MVLSSYSCSLPVRREKGVSFDESLLHLYPTHKEAVRATGSSQRDGTGSIRFLMPLTDTSFSQKLKWGTEKYPKWKMWLLLRNVPTLSRLYSEEINLHEECIRISSKRKCHRLSTWYTTDNMHLSIYMIPNSITSLYSSEKSIGTYTKSCEKITPIVTCMKFLFQKCYQYCITY